MKKIVKLPTILGLLILFAGLISGVLLLNSQAIFKLGAQTENSPKNVRISNITDSSFTVSWVTDTKSTGYLKWGTSESVVNKIVQENSSEKSIVHWVTVLGVDRQSTVFFKINSDGEDWDNNATPWKTTLLANKEGSNTNLNVSGTVVDQSGNPASDAIVYTLINGKIFSSKTSTEGSWVIPLSSYVDISNNSIIEISVDAGINGSSTALIYPQAAKNTPPMVLGKTYDFRTIKAEDISNLPESDISIPDQVEKSSRFEISDSENQNTTQEVVTLDSIDEGEIITTTTPEFFGTGPRGQSIEITVESEAQTTILSPNSSGNWSWSPPDNLEPGEHTVSIKWEDENGILRTITRSFVVSAAEGPAFEATPSATPKQTSTPTSSPTTSSTSTPVATSTSTSTPVITPKSTEAPGLPDAGVLTPTLGLFIMGIGILLSSIFVWRTANAESRQ